jgi:hypothetical protein
MALKQKPEEPIEQHGAPGYTPDGASLWSRKARRGKHVDTTPTHERVSWSRLDLLIEHETEQVQRLQRRIAETRDPRKIAEANDRLAKTQILLDRLRTEQRTLVS